MAAAFSNTDRAGARATLQMIGSCSVGELRTSSANKMWPVTASKTLTHSTTSTSPPVNKSHSRTSASRLSTWTPHAATTRPPRGTEMSPTFPSNAPQRPGTFSNRSPEAKSKTAHSPDAAKATIRFSPAKKASCENPTPKLMRWTTLSAGVLHTTMLPSVLASTFVPSADIATLEPRSIGMGSVKLLSSNPVAAFHKHMPPTPAVTNFVPDLETSMWYMTPLSCSSRCTVALSAILHTTAASCKTPETPVTKCLPSGKIRTSRWRPTRKRRNTSTVATSHMATHPSQPRVTSRLPSGKTCMSKIRATSGSRCHMTPSTRPDGASLTMLEPSKPAVAIRSL
mmetsp:Transcript_123437/g.356885  ORF Transcript_123437/g.356885 Transcript_123437/m.356885 type:complete len:340 (-) Transcript_123437:325-1344(-)